MMIPFWLKVFDRHGNLVHEELMELHRSKDEGDGFDLGFGPLSTEHDVMLKDGSRVSVSVEEE